MAPRMLRDYHSAVEPNSYSLRTTTKRSEDHFPRAHDVDVSRITGKEDFFRSMGLQMKRHQTEYKMLNGSDRTRKINIPDGVTLRDCSVVILGSRCKICGKRFKCATDLIVHETWKHGKFQKTDNVDTDESTRAYDNDKETREIASESTEDAVVGSPATKVQRKLRLTFRIGDEVVARMTMKRKHLRINRKTDTATQTERTHDAEELIIGKGEGAVPRIDLPVLDNSPCQCCNSGFHVVNSTNQYLAGNIVASKDTKCEENATKDCAILDTLTAPCATPAGEKVDVLDVLSSRTSCNLRATEQNDAKDKQDIFSSPNVSKIPTPCEKDINANVKPVDTPSEKQAQNSGMVNTIILPLILPIIVSNSNTLSAEDATVSSSQQESPKSPVTIEKNDDDEVQEVLRIVRGQSSNKEINHESPNRNEQEMLLRDAIKDMVRMEERGWHLSGKEPPKKKARVSGKSRIRIANEESAKKKKRATVSLNVDINVNKSTKEKCVSSAKEPFAKVQNFDQRNDCTSDNVKENLMICNGNINVLSEIFQRYGINYYNEAFEINNNTQIQEPVSCFLAPCSGGMENRSNKPTIIDLVNDTDE